jgi:dipeptidyl aminopeptidase/acylaminoacyl peptidase
MSHGGPTAAASSVLNPAIQYWTSRGFAVLDVDYGGSSGYGRAYRERLRGKWGIVDVDDCCHGALYLARLFRAGASYYGVSDLEALARETHKFESRYLDRLVAPYPARKDLYEERSPIHHVGRLDCPVIFFQGLEDEVVPPNQSKMMFDALRKKGIPTAYLAYEGEQHGFRRAENIKRSLDAELYFYGRVFGFAPADGIEEVEIENL